MNYNNLMISVLLSLFACALSCKVATTPNDQERLQGIWLAQTESLNGIKKEVDFQYIFTGNQVVFIDETGNKVTYMFTLSTTTKPKFLMIRPKDAPIDSPPVSVAYELDDDVLTIAIAAPGLRPTDVSDTNNQELIICKRKTSL